MTEIPDHSAIIESTRMILYREFAEEVSLKSKSLS